MDTMILGLRVLVALGAVLGFIWLVQKRLGKGKGRRRADAALTVVSRQVVGQKASVVVVDAGDKRFLLGVTEHAVTVLHSGDTPAITPEPEEAVGAQSAGSFAELFRQASGRPQPELRPQPLTGSLPEPVTDSLPVLRRRSELHRRGQMPEHPLHGSILSASTWRQASDAIRGRRN
ncbi:flagellar biosynthetic protein FliO [Arthrobacter sp. fls2-241-R2A-172]|uniref:flagellar biosynthetic protein FliO n=1 Tax=Arthrobacter sp. fls2-241-R2A-172 TaxID=3040325 RepID=UPI00254D8310|nr:flagellar biosynthetic protein FliO [Arthrobacter sp. fls2-241-R2A-172]